MHILMVGFDKTLLQEKQAGPGDTRERHVKYARALRQRYPDGQISVLLWAPEFAGKGKVTLAPGLTVCPVGGHRYLFPFHAVRALRKCCGSAHPDIVTTQDPFDAGLVGAWLRRVRKIPFNVQMRASFLDMREWLTIRPRLHGFLNLVGKRTVRSADTVRVVSLGEKERLETLFPHLRSRVHALPPLVNVSTFLTPASESEVQDVQHTLLEAGLVDVPVVLLVGRLAPQKDIPTLFRAGERLARHGKKVAIVLAGGGPLRRELQDLAVRLNVADQIVWLGPVPLSRLRGWYHAADVTVLPSRYEGFGRVIAESYLAGTPVIVTPVVSARELVVDGETGFIVPFGDVVSLADRLEYMIADPRAAEEMGRRGREHILGYLPSEEAYMERLIDIWEATRDAATC